MLQQCCYILLTITQKQNDNVKRLCVSKGLVLCKDSCMEKYYYLIWMRFNPTN